MCIKNAAIVCFCDNPFVDLGIASATNTIQMQSMKKKNNFELGTFFSSKVQLDRKKYFGENTAVLCAIKITLKSNEKKTVSCLKR